MKRNKLHPKIKEAIAKVTGKRPKTVIDWIVKHGMVTTEELEHLGYVHPPRAARDVRENGIPLETFRVRAKGGKSIAAYRFGDPEKISNSKLGGRLVLSKEFKAKLVEANGSKCAICNERYDESFLQIDHRVPYEVVGDHVENDIRDFMLVCASCNRKKSWACEHCPNWLKDKNPDACKSCFWASPEKYDHVALKKERRIELVWRGDDEVKTYDKVEQAAKKAQKGIEEFTKDELNKSSG